MNLGCGIEQQPLLLSAIDMTGLRLHPDMPNMQPKVLPMQWCMSVGCRSSTMRPQPNGPMSLALALFPFCNEDFRPAEIAGGRTLLQDSWPDMVAHDDCPHWVPVLRSIHVLLPDIEADLNSQITED